MLFTFCNSYIFVDIYFVVIFQIEIAAGRFPFPNWNSIFDQLSEVVNGVAPKLVNNANINFSENCLHFVNSWYDLDISRKCKS